MVRAATNSPSIVSKRDAVLDDLSKYQNIVLAMLRMMVRAPLPCLGVIVIAIALNSGLASILCVTIPLLALTLFLILRSSLGFSV